MIKSAISRLASGFLSGLGYALMPKWQLDGWEMVQHLKLLFEKYKIQTVIDVGANKGQYAIFLREQIGYKGLILSFEPSSSNYEILKKKAERDGNWGVYGIALGSENTQMKLNVMKNDTFSSFLTPDHSRSKEKYVERNVVEYQETVDVKRLDDFWQVLAKQYKLENIYLKLDTQGFDLEVVKGAPEFLKRVLAMQTELSMVGIYQGMPNYVTALETLRTKEFYVSGMFPVSQDDSLRVIEFDCVLVKCDKP